MRRRDEQQHPFDLLSVFIHLRKNGVNRDEAWFQVCDENPNMHSATRQAFANLAKKWERRTGYRYHYRDQSSEDETMSRKQFEQKQSAQQREQFEQAKADYTRIGSGLTGALDPATLRRHEQRHLEQVLEQTEQSPETHPPAPSKPQTQRPAPQFPPDFFGPDTELLIYFVGYTQPMVIEIEGEAELYIGRSTPNEAMAPEIDLNKVNGSMYGVSRMHAAITRRDNKLLIADLGSMNYTRINGARLVPKDIRTLQNDDEIWFGHLRCQIRFKHNER